MPLLELALFNEFFFELLLTEDDELINIAFRASMRNSMLSNRLTEKQKEDSENNE